MKGLVVVAHGSRRQASNEEVRELAARIAEKAGKAFDIVQSAFLELADPSIPDGIRQCIEKGAREVIVLPYFLSAGRHVAEDIPAEVDATRSEFPDIDIRIAPYLGSIDQIADLMVEQAIQTA